MTERLNVLVTGCGGDLGQSVGKILRATPGLFENIIGADIHRSHAGVLNFEQFIILPRADSVDYVDRLQDALRTNNIDLVIPASEPEIRVLTDLKLSQAIGETQVILPNESALNVGLDKLNTIHFLEEHKFLAPKTTEASEIKNPVFPIILKPRRGSGSKLVQIVKDQQMYDCLTRDHKDLICQEYLRPDDQEYTCGLYRSPGKGSARIILKRILGTGFTTFAEVKQEPSIDRMLERLGAKLDLNGSINIQLRLTSEGPSIFEINARFSSTVRFRHLMGFEDVIWSVKERFGIPYDLDFKQKPGTKCYKTYDELILQPT